MLAEILQTDIYRFLAVFARVGAMFMLLPGIGAAFVSPRIRLLFAIAVSFLLTPILGPKVGAVPQAPVALLLFIVAEFTIGVFLALVVHALMAALDLAGNYIGYQAGMTNAFIFDPVSQQQNSLITGFLNTLAMLLLFATDMHHLMFRGLVQSYELFQPGMTLPMEDFAQVLAQQLSASFLIGLQLAAPLLAFGLIFNASLGLMSRLAPQMQVFFVALPLQILMGFALLMVALPAIMMAFLRHVENGLAPMAGG